MSHPKSIAEAQGRYAGDHPARIYNRLVAISSVGDAVVVLASLILAYWLRFETALSQFGVPELKALTMIDYSGHFLVGLGIMLAILTNFRLYERRNFLSIQRSSGIIIKSAIVWIAAYLSLSLILKFNPPISRIYGVTAMVTLLILLPAWRWILWRIVRHESFASRLRQRALVIGWNPDFDRAFKLHGRTRNRYFDVCGVVKPPGGKLECALPAGVNVIGRHEDLSVLLKMQICDSVLVADANFQNRELTEIASLCEKEMIDFKLVPTFFQVLLSGLHLESLSGIPVLGISKLPLHSAANQYIKRVVDIAGALVGLTLAAPLMAIFGTLIYLESPGSIFYRQRRLGQKGKLFNMIKLRSMRLDAEKDQKPGWTVKEDPRCLRIGKFMRRWNIDEIPQFWNVLKGDMSLVGPRPERPELIVDFKENIPHYNARHHIKPGITGWAQVNGLRGDTDLGERIRFDLHYIENWNLLFDFQIMAMTFFKRENAC
jgi:exopolysaccharide biosynthesis polyprenyl glycosylphosphotransferase